MVDAVPLKHHPDALAALQQLSASESVAEAMQRQRPAEAFGQAIRRGRVEHNQLLVQSLERMLRVGVRGCE